MGKFKHAAFERGKLIEREGRQDRRAEWDLDPLHADPEIFGKYDWRDEFIAHRLRYYAYLNSGLKLAYNGETYQSKNGLKDLLAAEIGDGAALRDRTSTARMRPLEFAFTHTNAYGESYFSFVNGQYTNDGGTHQSAFREGVLKAINEFSGKSFAGEDVRDGLRRRDRDQAAGPGLREPDEEQARLGDVRDLARAGGQGRIVPLAAQHPEAARRLVEKVAPTSACARSSRRSRRRPASAPRRSPSASRS
jgi:topoisomerase-4 subunit B